MPAEGNIDWTEGKVEALAAVARKCRGHMPMWRMLFFAKKQIPELRTFSQMRRAMQVNRIPWKVSKPKEILVPSGSRKVYAPRAHWTGKAMKDAIRIIKEHRDTHTLEQMVPLVQREVPGVTTVGQLKGLVQRKGVRLGPGGRRPPAKPTEAHESGLALFRSGVPWHKVAKRLAPDVAHTTFRMQVMRFVERGMLK